MNSRIVSSREGVQTVQKMIAAMLIGCGCLLCLCACDTEAFAQLVCVPEPPASPAICQPAHELSPGAQGNMNLLCGMQNGQCIPPVGSLCGSLEGYGQAVGGVCKFFLDESVQPRCIKNDHVTTLQLLYYRTACEVFQGKCQCIHNILAVQALNVKVCDCKEEANE